jgi:hypothetical protein
VNDEDSLPGAHPNCWSNDSRESSQVGSDVKSSTDLSSSAQKDPKPHLTQYLNPFREKSASKAYKIDPTVPSCPSDGEASSFSFPSSDENEDIRRYRSGKETVYDDPDLSFNSALDESSDADDELRKRKEKEEVVATAEQKEAFKKGIKADRNRKKRYKLEKGKEAVWGSASERENRRKARSLRKKNVESPKITGGKKTVTFEIDDNHEARSTVHRAERSNAKLQEMCRAFVEDVHDEDFLPGAHPNCEAGLGSNERGEVFTQQDVESTVPALNPVLKFRTTNTSVSPSKSGSSSRHGRPKRPRNALQMPQSDDDKDEDLCRYRQEEIAQPPQEDAAPSWRSTRAYRNKKSKQRRFSHGEDEKFWDEPSSWGGEAGSSEDDWGEAYRSDNSRNSSRVAMGGCACCVVEAQTKRRRQHYRSPPVIHHPELSPTNPFLPNEASTTAVVPQTHARRRSSIDPWSPDPPSVRRHRREKTSESATYHVPDAPAPVLNSTRPELPARRRTENPESSPQATRPDSAPRRRTENAESLPQAVARPELPRRTIRTAVREHSPTNIKTEIPKRRIENTDDAIQAVRPDIGRRPSLRNKSPTRPDTLRRRTETLERDPIEGTALNSNIRPDMLRRRTETLERDTLEGTALNSNMRPDMLRRRTETLERDTLEGTALNSNMRPDMLRRRTDTLEREPNNVAPQNSNPRPDMLRRRTDTLEREPNNVAPQNLNTRPDMLRRRTDTTEKNAVENGPQTSHTRPEPGRRRTGTVEREHELVDGSSRPEMQRRGTVDREHNKPREKILRFDIK